MAFTSGARLYKGDRFFIDALPHRIQNFGAGLILRSDDNIEMRLSDLDVDNTLGRILYIGDTERVDEIGTDGSITEGLLGVNLEHSVHSLSVLSNEDASRTMESVDLMLEQLNQSRTQNGALQNRIGAQIRSIESALVQTKNSLSRIQDADIATETAQLARSQIITQAGTQMLRQVNLIPQAALQLIESASLI